MLYNDPLLPPAEWPGVRAGYRFAPSPPPERSARLVLSFLFDPALVVRGGAAPTGVRVHGRDGGMEPAGEDGVERRQVEAALLRYATVAAQLADSATHLVVTQSVLPAGGGGVGEGGAVGDGAAVRGELAAFAGRVVGQLLATLSGGTAAPEPLEIAIPLDPAGLASRTGDVFPVAVSLTLSRPPERVDPQARAWTPGAVSAAMEIAPDLDPPQDGTPGAHGDGPPPSDAGLTRFGSAFEAAFAGFDGAGGAARLAVRSAPPGAPAPAGSPSPWGVRWSKAHGVHAAFRQGAAACFTLAPLSTRLVNGRAQVPTYDPGTLDAAYAGQTFSGVDLDAWARAYLAAVDEVLSPATAAAVAALDGASYRALVDARSRLARALARGVVPVFPSVPGGDLAAAQDRFEQSVLAALSTAYAVSSIVQVPADVAAAGAAEPGSATPRFFGSIGLPGADPAKGSGYTISGGRLPIRTTTPESPGFLTFLVAVAQPERVAGLELDLQYRARFVEHLLDAPEAAYGSALSEWLRFVLDSPDDPLTLALGTVNAPVPVRAFPAAPVLQEQRAEQTPCGGSGSAADPPLLWDYTAVLAHPGQAAQDELRVSVTYNLPLDGSGPRLAAAQGTTEAVFEALASFTAAWPVLQPHVAALPQALSGGGSGGPTPARVVAALLEQVQRVSRAWGTLRGIVDGGGGPPSAAAPAAEAPPPVSDLYVLSFADALTAGVLRVFARAKQADDGCDPAGIVWPLVDGRVNGPVTPAGADAPDGTGCWFTADYEYAPPSGRPAGTLELTWPGLDVVARQTGVSACWIARNANLGEGSRTNPELVYETAPVSFARPVVPAIVVPPRAFPPGAALAATLEGALGLFAEAGTAVGEERRLMVAVTYRFRMGAPDDGEAPWSELPVLLAEDVQLAAGSAVAPSGGTVAVQQLAARLAAETDTWYGMVEPSTEAAQLGLDVVLFADVDGVRLPIIHAPDRVIEVPVGWWPRGG